MTMLDYAHNDKINEACNFIFKEAFQKTELPERIKYDIEIEAGYNFYVLRVFVRFETKKLRCYLTFNLDPYGHMPIHKPEVDGLYNIFLYKAVLNTNSEGTVHYEWNSEEKSWNLAIKPDDENFLNSMKGRLKRDSNRIIDFLDKQEEGFRSTTARLEMDVMDFPSDDRAFLIDLDKALRFGALKRGLLLDWSHHGCKVEGMPYNLDFILIKNF